MKQRIDCVSVNIGFYLDATASNSCFAAILPTVCSHLCSSFHQVDILLLSEVPDISDSDLRADVNGFQ